MAFTVVIFYTMTIEAGRIECHEVVKSYEHDENAVKQKSSNLINTTLDPASFTINHQKTHITDRIANPESRNGSGKLFSELYVRHGVQEAMQITTP
jgi:hypothetical protein